MACIGDYWLCVGVSIFTIVQTILHIWWIVFGRKLFSCSFEITQKLEFYVYLTYLYSPDCDVNPLQEYITQKNGNGLLHAYPNTTDDIAFFNFFLQRATFPHNIIEHDLSITSTLMLLNFIIDSLWFVASVSLLVGTICKIKEHSALVFFGPWIIIDVLALALDLFGAIYFGMQIPKSHGNMKSRSEDTTELERFLVPNSAAMAIVSGRLGVIWLINCILLYFVGRATIRACKQRYVDERSSNDGESSAAARIRNWQQFYGVIENEQHATQETKCELSYGSTFKDLEDHKDDLCSTLKPSQVCSLGANQPHLPPKGGILKGHLPWSYTHNQEMPQRNQDLPKSLIEKKRKHVAILPVKPPDVHDVHEHASRF